VIHVTKKSIKTLVFCNTKYKFCFQLDITFYNFIDFKATSNYSYPLYIIGHYFSPGYSYWFHLQSFKNR